MALFESEPNEGGELIEEPNEPPNGDDALAIGCCWPTDGGADIEPNGIEGLIEKVEPPKLNEGDCCDENMFCDGPNWPAKEESYGD